MVDNEIYKRAEKRADEKIDFYKHLYTYIFVNFIFLLVNVIFSPGEYWFLWISFFWGIGVISQFLKVFVFYDKFLDKCRSRMIEREMKKFNP